MPWYGLLLPGVINQSETALFFSVADVIYVIKIAG
jgi:hypothetical protein